MLWSAAVTDEMSNEAIEAARALRATADATKEAIGAIEKTGGFLNRVFGDIVEDSIGVVADRIKFYRIQNYLALSENTARIMRDRGYSDADITRVVTPKVAIPLIESATLEDDNELQALWAQLLANAMDSKFNLDVRLRHVSLLREMEPLDARILNACYSEKLANHDNVSLNEFLFERKKTARNFRVAESLIEVSLLNLIRLSCIDPGFLTTSISTKIGGRSRNHSIYVGTESYTLTLLGAELCIAAGKNRPRRCRANAD